MEKVVKPKVEKVVKLEKVELDHNQQYEIISTGKTKHLKIDVTYTVGGALAEILINCGRAKLA